MTFVRTLWELGKHAQALFASALSPIFVNGTSCHGSRIVHRRPAAVGPLYRNILRTRQEDALDLCWTISLVVRRAWHEHRHCQGRVASVTQ